VAPTNKIGKAAGFNETVKVLGPKQLQSFVRNVKSFFGEFKSLDLKNLSDEAIEHLLNMHKLSIDDILSLGIQPKVD